MLKTPWWRKPVDLETLEKKRHIPFNVRSTLLFLIYILKISGWSGPLIFCYVRFGLLDWPLQRRNRNLTPILVGDVMYFTTMSSPNLFMNDRAASSTICHNNTWNSLSRSERRRNSNAGINEIKVHVSVIKWDRVMSNFKRPKNREKL